MRLPHISIQTNMIFQGLAFAAQVLTAISPMVPDQYKELIAPCLAILQWVIAQRAHVSTPSGKPLVEQCAETTKPIALK